jgi:hypothetical protein
VADRDARVEHVIICTPDKDLAQCVRGTRIVQPNRRTRVTLDERGVIQKFGVSPESIPDYLALVGDSADGHPGLRGWGAKSSAAVSAHTMRRAERRRTAVEALEEDSIKAARGGVPAAASYKFSRLCFRRDIIESLGPTEMFQVITPTGTFPMTKSEFYRDFHNVVASKSYREVGIYHYPKLPVRAEQYRL